MIMIIIIIIIIIIIVYWYPSRILKAELQGRSETITEDNTTQKQSSRYNYVNVIKSTT